MKIFLQFAITMFGLLAGGMVLIATGLVPYWRSLEPAEFTQVFATSLPTVAGTMIVLTILGTGSMVLAAGLAMWKQLPNRIWLAAGAFATLVMLVCVPLYFGSANPLLAGGTLSADAIAAELATWQQLHWFRTIVSVLGLFCAVRSGYVASRPN